MPIIEIPRGRGIQKAKEPWNKNTRMPRANSVWTPERDRVLEEMYFKGCRNAEIGDQLGLTAYQVMSRIYIRRRNGTLPKLPPRIPGMWTEEDSRKFCRMYREGASYSEIAETLGRSLKACEQRASDLRTAGKLPKRREYVRKVTR